MVWLWHDSQEMKPRLFVCIPFLTPSIGGGAFVFFNILKLLTQKFDIHVVYFQKRAKEFIPSDLPSYLLEKQTGKIKYYLQYPKIILQASKLIKTIKPDIIITNSYQPYWIFLVARFITRFNPKLITGEQNNLTEAIKGVKFGKLRHYLIKRLDPLADFIVVPSKGIYQHLICDFKMPAENITIINNPVITEDIKKLSQELVDHIWLSKKDAFVILTAGVIDKQKDPVSLLHAFALVRKRLKAKCIFLGEGPMLPELKQITKDLEIDDSVAFLGFEKNPFRFMANADVFVLSSIYEGFGNVIVEAMACGCPVVATKCPYGPEEIITDGIDGLLSPIGDIHRLANNILHILNNKKLKSSLIQNGYKRAMDFTAIKIAHEYSEVINKCLQN